MSLDRMPAVLGPLAAWLIGCGVAAAQPVSAPRDQPSRAAVAEQAARDSARSGSGAISGRVSNRANAMPLGRARVILSSAALSEPRVTLSRGDGTFEFTHLPAGSYTLSASHTGYASREYGEPQPETAALTLADGQALKALDVTLLPAGVIAGGVLDEDGQPFAGALIDALVPRTEEGQQTLAAMATVESDDRGEFRLAGLAPGVYFVSASDPAFARAGDETGPLRYSATYYPGVASIDQATRIKVTSSGEPAAPIRFPLKIVRPARVSGRIIAPAGQRLLSAAVIMTPAAGARPGAPGDTTILPDGTFTFRNVPPGRYDIRARGEIVPGGPTHFAAFRVLIEGTDVGNIQMPLAPGATVSGTLAIDAARSPKPPIPAGIRVRAPLADGNSFGDALTGEVARNGAYAILGLAAGSHLITLEGLPYPWVLKSVTAGGQDITDQGLDADAGRRFENVRITITDTATELSGVVRNPGGGAVAGAVVFIIPLSQQFWHRGSRRFGLLRTDGQGRFNIRGLPGGEYRAAASLDADESDAERPAVLEELSEAGVPVSLRTGEARALDLALLPRHGLRGAATR